MARVHNCCHLPSRETDFARRLSHVLTSDKQFHGDCVHLIVAAATAPAKAFDCPARTRMQSRSPAVCSYIDTLYARVSMYLCILWSCLCVFLQRCCANHPIRAMDMHACMYVANGLQALCRAPARHSLGQAPDVRLEVGQADAALWRSWHWRRFTDFIDKL